MVGPGVLSLFFVLLFPLTADAFRACESQTAGMREFEYTLELNSRQRTYLRGCAHEFSQLQASLIENGNRVTILFSAPKGPFSLQRPVTLKFVARPEEFDELVNAFTSFVAGSGLATTYGMADFWLEVRGEILREAGIEQ